ncbi:hypothetical protein [Streptomyces iakyrus]|uniref:hypothetical protein n=1 Tax=Streptomyces iakyrus TaxID=68219 RepID=UPI003D8E880A
MDWSAWHGGTRPTPGRHGGCGPCGSVMVRGVFGDITDPDIERTTVVRPGTAVSPTECR